MIGTARQTTTTSAPLIGLESFFSNRPVVSSARGTRWHSGPVRRFRYDLLGRTIEAVRIGSAEPEWVAASNLTDYKEQLIAAMDADTGVVLCIDDNDRLVLLHAYRYTGTPSAFLASLGGTQTRGNKSLP